MLRRYTDTPVRVSRQRIHLIIAFVCAVLFAAPQAHAAPPYAEILIDPATGAVLHARNPDVVTQPASLTKVMTLFLAFDALERGKLSLDQRIPVSRRAQNMSPSKLGLLAGDTIRVEDAILGLVTRSANDAAVVLAEAIGGDEEAFAEMMTTKAQTIGMRSTVFRNASGLPNSRQTTTARDIAVLSESLIKTHAKYYPYFSRSSFTFNGTPVMSHNKLMRRYEGMDGIKTGFVNASGFNLAATAVRDGRRLIAVVLGGRTARERDNRVAALLDQGFGIAPRRPNLPTVAVAAAVPTARASVAAIKAQPQKPSKPAESAPKKSNEKVVASAKSGTWSIQVGSYRSEKAGQAGLAITSKAIPALVKGAGTTVIKSRNGTFQARFTGMTKASAQSACARLEAKGQDCLVLAPRN